MTREIERLPGWKLVTLGDICAENKGLQTGPFGSQLHASEYTDRGIPVVMPKDMISGRVSHLDVARIPEQRAYDLKKHRLVRGDIVFARRGDIGRCVLITAEEDGWICGTGCLRARLSSGALPNFIIYHLGLSRTVAWINANAVGQTMLNLNTSILSAIPLHLPSLPEQHKIAAILDTWDKAIALTEQLIAAKQQRKKGLMQQLLTGQVRFPGCVKSSERFDTKFGWLPVDWRLVPLQKLVKPISRLEAVQPGKEYRLIGVKWYVAGAHVHSILSGENIKTASLSRVEENDIIYNKMWTTKAAFAIAKPEHSNTYGTTEYPQFRAKENLQVDFLEYAFHLPRFQYDAITLCRGTTGRARLNPKDFLKLKVPLPPLAEQRQIAATLQACDAEIDLLHQKLDALQRQKKGLMQQLLTGRVRVKV